MKVLSVGPETSLFNEKSPARGRIASYGQLCDELHIVVPSTKKSGPVAIASNVFVYSTNSWSLVTGFFDTVLSIVRIVREKRFDPQQDLISAQDPFEMGFACWVAHILTGLPLHIQVHIDFFSPYYKRESIRNFFQFFLAKFVIRQAASIRAVSKKIEAYLLAQGIAASRITTAPVYTDPQEVQASHGQGLGEKYPAFYPIVLCMSRLVKQKNIPLAVSAFKEFVVNHPEAGLVIVGSGSEEEKIKRLVQKEGLEKHVIFEPWTNDRYSYFKTANIFLLTSDYEGWGLTCVEAAIAGTPVVMTDVGCAGEFIIDRDNGLVVSARDRDAVIHALHTLTQDTVLRDQLIKNGLQSARLLPSRARYNQLLVTSWQKAFL